LWNTLFPKKPKKPFFLSRKSIVSAKTRREYRRRLQELKESLGCADCKVKYPHYVLDFDHLPGTTNTVKVSDSVERSWSRILEEIAKCEVVCSNCHRKRTFTRGQNYQGTLLRNGTSPHKKPSP
jgi:hypothetical protein